MRRKLKMEERGHLFAWPVATAYSWGKDYVVDRNVKGPEEADIWLDGTGPWLLEFGPPRWSTPLSTPTLHRKFGNLETEAQPIIGFARAHGWLGFHVALSGIPLNRKRGEKVRAKPKRTDTAGESMWRWKREIAEMALWLGIWDLIQQRDAGKLGQLVKWPNPDVVVLEVALRRNRSANEVCAPEKDGPFTFRRIADRDDDAQVLKRWRVGDVIEPARYALYTAINEKLKERVYVQLAWPYFESVESFIVPKSMLAALWLMFMWEVIGATALLRCPVCGDWVERSIASQKTCSAACKQRQYRNRQRANAKGGTP